MGADLWLRLPTSIWIVYRPGRVLRRSLRSRAAGSGRSPCVLASSRLLPSGEESGQAGSSPETSVGEAVVDPATGAIHSLRFRPADNPKFVDRMDVQMEYGAATPEGPALSRVTIEGAGGVLFIKKRMKMTVKLSEYEFGAAR